MSEYMIFKNGHLEPEDPECAKARAEYEKNHASDPLPPPSPEREIAELKRQNAEMRRMIEALANGDTGPEVTA